jgi:hypothetical protein
MELVFVIRTWPPESRSMGGDLYGYRYERITALVLISFLNWSIRHFSDTASTYLTN